MGRQPGLAPFTAGGISGLTPDKQALQRRQPGAMQNINTHRYANLVFLCQWEYNVTATPAPTHQGRHGRTGRTPPRRRGKESRTARSCGGETPGRTGNTGRTRNYRKQHLLQIVSVVQEHSNSSQSVGVVRCCRGDVRCCRGVEWCWDCPVPRVAGDAGLFLTRTARAT